MDTKIYLKSSIVYSSSLSQKYMPASFFYLALVCSAVLIYRSIGPWVQNQILINHLSNSVFATFSSISPSLNLSPVFFPFLISPRWIHRLISMAGFQGLRFSFDFTLFPEYNYEDRKRNVSCPYDGWAEPLHLSVRH